MNVLEKVDFKKFSWLNSHDLPSSHGFKFELYGSSELGIEGLIQIFYSLFVKFNSDIYISQFGDNAEWGNFCIETWDFKNDLYDYSPAGKSTSASNYLRMLSDNSIEPGYQGFCRCLNWDEFLPVILDCIVSKTAPYSLMFHIKESQIVFYFHHTESFGVYYKEFNEDVLYIIDRSIHENLEIKYSNDSRVLEII